MLVTCQQIVKTVKYSKRFEKFLPRFTVQQYQNYRKLLFLLVSSRISKISSRRKCVLICCSSVSKAKMRRANFADNEDNVWFLFHHNKGSIYDLSRISYTFNHISARNRFHFSIVNLRQLQKQQILTRSISFLLQKPIVQLWGDNFG